MVLRARELSTRGGNAQWWVEGGGAYEYMHLLLADSGNLLKTRWHVQNGPVLHTHAHIHFIHLCNCRVAYVRVCVCLATAQLSASVQRSCLTYTQFQRLFAYLCGCQSVRLCICNTICALPLLRLISAHLSA